MSEKRFYLDKNGIKDREYEFSLLGEDELVDIINGLVDENERLRTRLNNIKIYVEFQLQEIENDLKISIKGGMPTGGLYEEINLLKDLQTVIYNVRD